MLKNYKLGVIGVGFVGGALYKYFRSQKAKIFVYDKYKRLGSPEEVNKADVVFVCVPTPYHPKNGFDISAVESAIKVLNSPKIVVIKSSIIPGATQALQKKFAGHKIIFNPEFMRESYAYYDMVKPDRQLVGYTKKSRGAARKVMDLLPKATYQKVMPALEAEVIKYMANSFLALRVVFANEFYDLCKKLGADYNSVMRAVGYDPRIGHSHFYASHGGYRGYGGSCLPKDVNAIIQLAKSRKVNTELLKAMRKINRKYLKQGGLTEEYFLTGEHRKKI